MGMLIFYIGAFIAGAIFGLVPLVVKWFKAKRAKKTAKTPDEVENAELAKEKALSDLKDYMNTLIVQAEKSFTFLDNVMKDQNSSAGGIKKENVFTKLQAYAISKGYEFDADYWSKKIDEFVAFTKLVNSKK